jgi:hypothetical protein
MRLASLLPRGLALALGLALASACGSSEEPATIQNGGGGAASTSSAGGSGGAGGTAPPACASFAGAFRVEGTCTPGSLTLPKSMCVRQTACDVVVKTNADQTYEGTASPNVLKVTTNTPTAETCTAGHEESVVGVHCSGPKQEETCDAMATPVPLPGATGACCDLHADGCGAGARCVPVDTEAGYVFTACVADDGQAALGAPCERAKPTAQGVGHDGCQKGLYCSEFSAATPDARTCKKLCLVDGDCKAGEACFGVGATPWAGVCVPTCSLFDASTCAAGTTCRAVPSHDAYGLVWNTRCGATGKGAAGDACGQPEECGPGLGCAAGACAPYCDAKHACEGGRSCVTFPSRLAQGFDASTGACE